MAPTKTSLEENRESGDVRGIQPIQMCFSASTKVSTGMSGTFQAPIIDLVSIRPSRSPSQTHNVQVLPKRPKAVHPGRAAEQGLLIREPPPDSEKDICSQVKANIQGQSIKNPCKREQQGWQGQGSSTPATTVNAAEPVEAKRTMIETKIGRTARHRTWTKFGVIIIIKRAIIQAAAPNLQKTSLGLGNLRAGDWN